MNVSFRIDFAGPFVSVQDRGRPGFMRYGVTESGPMDRTAFGILRRALEGPETFRALEISPGGVVLSCCSGQLTAGVVGGDFDIRIDGARQPAWSVFALSAGQKLSIRPGPSGSWCYLGFAGQIEGPEWLGSGSVHLASGLCGRALTAGDVLNVARARPRPDLHAAFPIPDFAVLDGTVRVVIGPQQNHFAPEALRALTTEPFQVTPEYDRMGMRLKGVPLVPCDALSIPSEALVRGSVQVPGHGDPLILLADHQTTGGYPKVATVITADIDRVAQARPEDRIRFRAVSPGDAVLATRAAHRAAERFMDDLSGWRGSLAERLSRTNLISGAVTGGAD